MTADSASIPNFSLRSRIAASIGLLPGVIDSTDCVSHQGPSKKVSTFQMIAGLIAHVMQVQGCFAFHMKQFFGMGISDSALSQRRTDMGSEPFRTILRVALRPLGRVAEHSGCFFKGLRLTGIDGTQWSLSNTAQINAATTKTRTRRGLAAFAKLSLVALVELGTHAPLAAAFAAGALREPAWSVALLAQLPPRSLLLPDRLYGQAPLLNELQKGCAASESHFLVRVRQKLAVTVVQAHRDGSATVSVRLRHKGAGEGDPLTVREVQGRVWNRGTKKWVTVRLWTSLSEKEAAALELLELYARRWEQEIFFKELKLELAGGALLQSHTVTTAEQEIAAEALPTRRTRSCARKVRQPVSKWPRMIEPESLSSPVLCEVSIIA